MEDEGNDDEVAFALQLESEAEAWDAGCVEEVDGGCASDEEVISVGMVTRCCRCDIPFDNCLRRAPGAGSDGVVVAEAAAPTSMLPTKLPSGCFGVNYQITCSETKDGDLTQSSLTRMCGRATN